MDASKIKQHLMVHAKGEGMMHDAPGVHVGTVDHLEEERYIKLTKDDSIDGQHHWVPLEWVESVDDKAVYLKKSADEVQANWLNQHPRDVAIAKAQSERDPISGAGIG